MKYLKNLFLVAILCQSIVLQANAQKIKLNTAIDSVSFYLGYMYGKQLQTAGIDLNVDNMASGLRDAMTKTPANLSDDLIGMFLQKYFTGLQTKTNAKYLKEGQDFLAANGKKAGIVTLPSGLQYRVIKEGTGAKPTMSDYVDLVYHGTLINGTVFDSSRERGDTMTFSPGQVISGFGEAITSMKVGAKWEVFIPAELGYGENVNPASGIKPNSVLIFEIDLVGIKSNEEQ